MPILKTPMATRAPGGAIPLKTDEIEENVGLYQRAKNVAYSAFSPLIGIYNFIYTKNPITLRREFRYVPTLSRSFENLYFVKILANWILSWIVDKRKMSPDSEIVKLVTEIGNRLVNSTKTKDPYQFIVVDENSIDAFVYLYHRNVVIHRGLVEKMNEFNIKGYEHITLEDKIAEVLAHEIGHVEGRHLVRGFLGVFSIMSVALPILFSEKYCPIDKIINIIENIEWALFQDLYSKCGFFENGTYYNYLFEAQTFPNLIVATILYGVCVNKILNLFLKSHEYEADAIGMHLMKKAGYDPKAALLYHEFRLQNKPEGWVARVQEFFSEHPTPKKRLENSERILQEIKKLD